MPHFLALRPAPNQRKREKDGTAAQTSVGPTNDRPFFQLIARRSDKLALYYKNCKPLQAAASHCKPLTASHCKPLQATASHCKPLQATASHCKPLQATASHCKPLQATASHCKPLQATASHCKPLQATASHCKPLAPLQLQSPHLFPFSGGQRAGGWLTDPRMLPAP